MLRDHRDDRLRRTSRCFRIGGVLVRGEKGTAKSTMVRGLAALLPPVPVVPGCPYSCDPAEPDPACPAGPHDDAVPQRAWSKFNGGIDDSWEHMLHSERRNAPTLPSPVGGGG